MANKEVYLDIFNKNIKREGSKKLLDWLVNTDFFDAPASSNFHSAYNGGLCDHSIKVYHRFLKIIETEFGNDWEEKFSHESIAICALLHDLCKIDFYKLDYRNVKIDDVWTKKPYYAIDDKLPYGHGEKSVYIINGFMKLTREEAMIINWHMGEFDLRVKGGSYSLSEVFYKYPISLLFHIADLQATYLDETRE
ncbi:MAG: hydrolase [Clostridia bacterium]|nr:hydrolase [Clostridia bacterium]